jgi:hypothetical protein
MHERVALPPTARFVALIGPVPMLRIGRFSAKKPFM